MSDKPVALQMADELDSLCDPYDSAIATELRRLHAEHIELGQALKRAIERINELEAEIAEQARVNGMGGEREAKLMAVNAELVRALRKCDEAMTWELGGEPLDTLMTDARNAARAALAKVEAST